MLQKFTITQVTEDKAIETKFGSKMKQSCKFKETGDIWHGIWGGGKKVGDIVEGTRESRLYDGKEYWDFKFPKKDEVATLKTDALEIRVKKLEDKVFGVKPDPMSPPDYPDEEVNLEDIPF